MQGKLYLAGSSSCQPVLVRLNTKQISIYSTDDILLGEFVRSEVSVTKKLASLPREITLPNRDLLTLDSTDEINIWLDGPKGAYLDKLERNKLGILSSLLLVPVALFGIFKYLIPALAIGFASYVPAPITDLASQHTLISLDKTLLNPSQLDTTQAQELKQYWLDTLAKLSLVKNYHVEFRQSEKMGANAFALPNGTIIFTDEMVKLVDGNKEMLTAILLHEVGHVELKHSMRLIAETLVISLAINYFFGDLEGIIELLVGASGAVLNNQYTQKLEWEADNYALKQLPSLGLEKEHFARAMEKLAEKYGDLDTIDNLFSSHPLLKERVENARN